MNAKAMKEKAKTTATYTLLAVAGASFIGITAYNAVQENLVERAPNHVIKMEDGSCVDNFRVGGGLTGSITGKIDEKGKLNITTIIRASSTYLISDLQRAEIATESNKVVKAEEEIAKQTKGTSDDLYILRLPPFQHPGNEY
jgi:hypothetical protein